ncbi:hypothetical protein ACWCOV_16665 [Kribbella sp. NPDC002412]
MTEYEFPPVPQPSEALRRLDRLVGEWSVSGGTVGTVTYEWMEGGYFLLQRVLMHQQGHEINGLEVIGHERPFGAAPGDDIKSRFYDSEGNTLDYVYELEGDTLTIWGGEKGSPAYFRGTFSDGDTRMDGEWVYPGGGGYQSTMTRSDRGDDK